jgi:tRNA (guanosine-2'-O-)-methyltransferase
VSEEIRNLSDGNFIIPQVGIIRSLNISVACAVTLYEAFRQKNLAGSYEKRNLPEEQYQALFDRWSENK